jgi:hypothetical protein
MRMPIPPDDVIAILVGAAGVALSMSPLLYIFLSAAEAPQ